MILLKQFIFAINNIMVGETMNTTTMDSVLLAFLRVILASTALFATAKYLGINCIISKEDDKMMRYFGLMLPVIILSYIYAVKLTSAVNVSLFMAGGPVFTALLMLSLGRERFSIVRFGGIGCTMMGCWLLIRGGQSDKGLHHSPLEVLIGDILLIINLIASAAFMVFQQHVLKRVHPIVLNAYSFAYCSVLLFFVAIIRYDDDVINRHIK